MSLIQAHPRPARLTAEARLTSDSCPRRFGGVPVVSRSVAGQMRGKSLPILVRRLSLPSVMNERIAGNGPSHPGACRGPQCRFAPRRVTPRLGRERGLPLPGGRARQSRSCPRDRDRGRRAGAEAGHLQIHGWGLRFLSPVNHLEGDAEAAVRLAEASVAELPRVPERLVAVTALGGLARAQLRAGGVDGAASTIAHVSGRSGAASARSGTSLSLTRRPAGGPGSLSPTDVACWRLTPRNRGT